MKSGVAIATVALCMELLCGCDKQIKTPESTPAAASSAAPVAKRSKADDEMIGLNMTGIDHLADHLSVQEFKVDGHSGAQAGKGGSEVCCVSVPRKWRPGMKVEVYWEVLNWRDRIGGMYKTVVEVEPYDELDRFFVHFLPDGTVRAVVSAEGPESPTYIGPHVPIPQKHPWDVYPIANGEKDDCTNYTVTPPRPCY